jgi:hypothetical protein
MPKTLTIAQASADSQALWDTNTLRRQEWANAQSTRRHAGSPLIVPTGKFVTPLNPAETIFIAT